MEVSLQSSRLWDDVVNQTKVAKEKGTDPLFWALQVSSSFSSSGIALPSTELAHVLVNYICWENNIPILWKFLDKALMMKVVPPLLVLALLSQRIMPCRRSHPAAYRLYLELLKRHVFTLKCQINGPNFQKKEIPLKLLCLG